MMQARLLTGAAIMALFATGTLAQTNVPAPTAPAATPSNGAPISPMDVPLDNNYGMTEASPTELRAPVIVSEGYSTVEGDNLVTRILGSSVYTSAEANAEVIGDINDLVVTATGGLTAVVVGVGGFLGVGEKDVAIAFADLQWSRAEDGTWRYVLNTPAEALSVAPDFIFADVLRQEPARAPSADAAPPQEPDPRPAAEQFPTGSVDRQSLRELDESTLTAEELSGIPVFGLDDEQIGSIGDFVLEPGGTSIDAVIVDVGGFLGIGRKPVAVGFDGLDFRTDADNRRYLFIGASRQQLESQPDFNRETYPDERDVQRMSL